MTHITVLSRTDFTLVVFGLLGLSWWTLCALGNARQLWIAVRRWREDRQAADVFEDYGFTYQFGVPPSHRAA